MEFDKPLPVKISPDWQKLPSVYYKEYETGEVTIRRKNIIITTSHKRLQELISKKKIITTEDEDLKVHKSGRSIILLFLSEHPKYKDKVTLELGKFNRYVLKVLEFSKGGGNE
ncbi:MAG: hypothetical protein QXJ68_08955 [Methanocellales archaeon]